MEERNRKAHDAWRLRKMGLAWIDIAKNLGITPQDARELIRDELAAAADLVDEASKRQLLVLEVARIDDLQAALWPAAMAGDTRAVETALKVILARAKLLGLDVVPDVSVNNTLVVAGTSEEYISALRQVVRGEIEEGA